MSITLKFSTPASALPLFDVAASKRGGYALVPKACSDVSPLPLYDREIKELEGFLPIQFRGSDWCISSSDCQRIFKIDEKKIIQASNENRLVALFEKRALELSFPEPFLMYDSCVPTSLIRTSLSRKKLTQIIKIGLVANSAVYRLFQLSGSTYAIATYNDREITRIDIRTSLKIEEGSRGVVLKTVSLFRESIEMVIKEAISSQNSTQYTSNKQILNEYIILHRIHQSKCSMLGIQEPPILVFQFNTCPVQYGYMVRRYDNDLFNFIESGEFEKLELEQKLDAMSQIAHGLALLHTLQLDGEDFAGIIHSDIKPENILILVDRDKISFFISDFGDAAPFSVTQKRGFGKIGAVTVSHTPFEDIALIFNLQAKREFEEVHRIQLERDIFAMGLTFFTMLTGLDIAFDAKDSRFKAPIAATAHSIEGYLDAYPKEITDLICKMTEPDARKRISAIEVQAIIDQVITDIT